MIRYLTHNQIDKKKWDECIHDAFNGNIYAYSWFLDIVSEDWEALIENDYERVFPLTIAKKWKIYYLAQPAFARQLGVFSKSLLTENEVSHFLKAIPARFRFAAINLNNLNKVPEGDYSVLNQEIFELDLIKTYDNLYNAYSPDLKQYFRQEIKAGYFLSKNIKPDLIIDLSHLNKTKKNRTLTGEEANKLKRLAYLGIYKGMISTFGIYSDRNNLVAGVILARSNKKLIWLFSGYSAEKSDYIACIFLADSIIKEHAQQHLTLSFEKNDEQFPDGFFRKFGATRSNFVRISYSKLPLLKYLFMAGK